MKKPVLQLTAVAIGLAASLAAFNFLKKSDVRSFDPRLYTAIGEIQSVEGQVERRLPQSENMETVPGARPLFSQDLVLTQKSSSAVLVFTASQTTLKLAENTRFIAELDSLKPGAIVGTLLDGNIQVLNSGRPGLFRLFREGHEIALKDLERNLVPILPGEGKNASAQNAPAVTPTPLNGLTISATLPEEPVGAAAQPPKTQVSEAVSNEILTNEDIVRQLRIQTGFFQRCYLNFIHRTQKPDSATVGQAGVVTVSFMIQSNGKVNETKVVRSDFKDTTLQNCITEVISRTVFRGFQGNPVPVLEFPISLQ
jgi:hypothetical protein